jgi:hypothetical protein
MEYVDKSTKQGLLKILAIIFIVFILIKICGGSNKTSTTKVVPTKVVPTLDWDKSSYAMQSNTKDFTTYPGDYTGKKIAIKCEVFNIIDKSQFQCWTLDEHNPVGVVTREDFSALYEDDEITVYGIGGGEYCGTNAFGGKVCQALLIKAWYTKP